MQTKNIRVIIVSMPGAWQNMLKQNLSSKPSVDVLAVANGSLSAMQMVEKNQPDLIFIDSSIPGDDAIALIKKIKLENPDTKSVVLTDTSREERLYCQAGADYALPTYNYISRIQEILDELNKEFPDDGDIKITKRREDLGS